MDMAPSRAEMRRYPADVAKFLPPQPPHSLLDAMQDVTQATMMAVMVWPMIVGMPFFWAPPFWILGSLASRALRPAQD